LCRAAPLDLAALVADSERELLAERNAKINADFNSGMCAARKVSGSGVTLSSVVPTQRKVR
jgi:hypothetical protein